MPTRPSADPTAPPNGPLAAAQSTSPPAAKASAAATPAAVGLFYSYAHEDEALRNELAGHLKILERRGLISSWHDRQIVPGQPWDQAIDAHLAQADLVLLLLSADFMGSDYIFGVELARAMQRQAARECEVVPILVRPIDLDPSDGDDLPFLKLQALPPDMKPVTTWANRDEAWTQVAKGLRATVKAIQARRPQPAQAPQAAGAAAPPFAPPPARTAPTPPGPHAPPPTQGPRWQAPQGPVWQAPSLPTWQAPTLPTWQTPAGPTAKATLPPNQPPAASPPADDDPLLARVMGRFVAEVNSAQLQRGGAPLVDRHLDTLQQEARALIDRADPPRVLWVDDRPDNNLRERAMLAQLQIEVVCVTSTREAVARLQADADSGEPFELVLSDWSRPVEGRNAVLQLINALREAGMRQPVLVYHGEAEPAARSRRAQRVSDAGGFGEAVLPAELLALVQAALAGAPQ